MKKSTEKTLLWVAGGAAALFILPDLLSKESSGGQQNPITNLFGGGDSGGGLSGLGDIFEGITGGLSDLFSGVTGAFSGVTQGLGEGMFGLGLGNAFESVSDAFSKAIDNVLPKSTTTNLPGEAEQALNASTVSSDGKYPPSYPNTVPNIMYSSSELVKSLGVTALEGVGAYLGYKALSPVVGRAAAAAAPQISRFITGGGNLAAKVGSNVVRGVGSGLGSYGALLRTPLSAIPATGALGMVGAGVSVVGAAVGGYALGSAFNKTSAGQALINWSGQQGANLARSNNWLSNTLFPKANLISGNTTVDTVSALLKKGYTQQQALQEIWRQRGVSPGSKSTTINAAAKTWLGTREAKAREQAAKAKQKTTNIIIKNTTSNAAQAALASQLATMFK